MQIWFFFQAGIGGDGFASLLEHSEDIDSIDAEHGYWRIHRIVNGHIKFFAPAPDQGQCFRTDLRPFRTHTNALNPVYLGIVQSGGNCVVTSHDVTLEHLATSDSKDIFMKDQIKVLITGDPDRSQQQAILKNLLPEIVPPASPIIDHAAYDIVVDIRDLQTDWNFTKSFCDSIGISLDPGYFNQYQSLLAGETTHMTNNYNVEIYRAVVDENLVHYELIDIWQPTID